MKMTSHHMSEEEYVERVRTRIKTVLRFRWVWPVLLVAASVFAVLLAKQFRQVEGLFGVERAGLLTGLFFGSCIGITLGLLAIQTGTFLMHWWDASHGFRTEKLMLKYHDELKEAEASNTILEPSSNRADAV